MGQTEEAIKLKIYTTLIIILMHHVNCLFINRNRKYKIAKDLDGNHNRLKNSC